MLAATGASDASWDETKSRVAVDATGGRNSMRLKMMVTLISAINILAFASVSAAQGPPNPLADLEAAQSAQGQQQSPNQAAPGQRPMGPVIIGAGMMPPGMTQMTGSLSRSMGIADRGPGSAGPLQMVSRLLAALDDPRVRTVLGLTDLQADSLRKIVVDMETYTIKTSANIAVDAIDLRELLRADKPDRTAVMSKGDEISKLTSQLINHSLDAMLAAKAVLTPEQQKMIRAYLESGAPALPTAFPGPQVRP
jgi:Spy/CpxP family protein refolding chaperone